MTKLSQQDPIVKHYIKSCLYYRLAYQSLLQLLIPGTSLSLLQNKGKICPDRLSFLQTLTSHRKHLLHLKETIQYLEDLTHSLHKFKDSLEQEIYLREIKKERENIHE